MSPKFAVGEVAILNSVDVPELNGDVTVVSVHPEGETVAVDGRVFKVRDAPFGYVLDVGQFLFSESALRKKYFPGELSFNDLMASLSSPKLLTHNPQ